VHTADRRCFTAQVWKSGGIVVPLATSHPPRELSYVLADAGIKTVLTGKGDASKLSDVASENNAQLILMDEIEPSAAQAPSSPSNDQGYTDPSTGALIIYTSGTTGKPKGVLHTHGSILAQVQGLVEAWEWSKEDRILHALPLHHIHGIVNALYCPAHVGAQVQFLPKFSPSSVWSKMLNGEMSVFMGVPTMYSYLLNSYDSMSSEEQGRAREAASKLRLTVSGSSACPVPIMNRWKELTGEYLLERYGMTEIGMALSNPYRGQRRPGAVGSPLPGVQVKIQEDGELLIKGPNLFREYWGRSEATKETFTNDGWFRTGDSAETVEPLEAGPACYRIMGRMSVDIIKSAGYKLSALMIENVILEHPGVAEVAVVGLPDDLYGEVVVALVARKDGHEGLSQGDLNAFCRERLAAYQAPKRWNFVESLPRNQMGKLNKKELVKDLLSKKKS
jgi:malonyl-CoA/methylmalonyl-CoA synthetase